MHRTWQTGSVHIGRCVVPSTLAHLISADGRPGVLESLAACGSTPRGPFAAEDRTMPGARRCDACQRKERP